MSVMDKLRFWKKDDSLELPSEPPAFNPPQGLSAPPLGGEPDFNAPAIGPGPAPGQPFDERQSFGQPQPSAFGQAQQQSFAQQSFSPPGQDQQLQLIAAKLDTIKAQLETVLNRLDAMERKNSVPEERPYQQRWRNI
ncbi:hypothetical protein C4580_04605 [Candidatus Woesearchaeota archaeon]|nr:MAG: hypothetical protein C4580_04605 [Candidatus Woesearchaeota archaeon]